MILIRSLSAAPAARSGAVRGRFGDESQADDLSLRDRLRLFQKQESHTRDIPKADLLGEGSIRGSNGGGKGEISETEAFRTN